MGSEVLSAEEPALFSLREARRCEARSGTRLLKYLHKTLHSPPSRVSTEESQRSERFLRFSLLKKLAGFVYFNARFDDVTTVSQITNGEFGFTLLEAESGSERLGVIYGVGWDF